MYRVLNPLCDRGTGDTPVSRGSAGPQEVGTKGTRYIHTLH